MKGRPSFPASPLPWLAVYLLLLLAWTLDPDHPRVAGLFHDDGVYFCLGENLAENGVYRDLHSPPPIRIAKYPPGVPLEAALGWELSGGDPAGTISFIRVFHSLFLVLALFAFHGILRREPDLPRPLLFLLPGALAFSPPILDYLRIPMSEIPFLGLSLLALLALLRAEERPERPWPQAALLSALFFSALLFRTLGAALLPALFIHLLLAGRKPTAFRFLALSVPLFLLLQGFLWVQGHPRPGFEDISIYGLPYGKILADGLPWLPRIVPANTLQGILYAFTDLVPPILSILPLASPAAWIVLWAGSLLTLFLFITGTRKELSRKPAPRAPAVRPRHLYVLFTLAVILFWPFQTARFLVPLIPFLLLAFARGVQGLAGPKGALAAGALLFLCALGGSLPDRAVQRRDHFTLEGKTWNLEGLFRAAEEARKILPEKGVLASTLDPFFGVHSNRMGVWGWTIRDSCPVLYGGNPSLFHFLMDLRRPWVGREIQAARIFFFERIPGVDPRWLAAEKARLGGAARSLEGKERPPLLARLEKSRKSVREQMRRVGVTHAVLLLEDGQPLFEVLLARLVRELALEGRAEPLWGTPSGTVQIWRIRP